MIAIPTALESQIMQSLGGISNVRPTGMVAEKHVKGTR